MMLRKTEGQVRHIIFILLAFPLFMIACSKEAVDIPERIDSPAFQMKLALGSGNQTMAISGPQLRDLVSQFTLIVFSPTTGEELFRQIQYSSSPDFGRLNLEVAHGTYAAIAIASKTSFGINEFFPSGSRIDLPFNSAFMEYYQDQTEPEEKRYKTSDTFLAAGLYTIDRSGDVDLVLQRIVGKLKIEVNDIDQFEVRVKNEASGIFFESGKPAGTITNPNYQVVTGSKDQPIDLYILNTAQPLQMEISGEGKTVALNVPVYKNQHTVVSGNLLESNRPAILSSRSGSTQRGFQTTFKPL